MRITRGKSVFVITKVELKLLFHHCHVLSEFVSGRKIFTRADFDGRRDGRRMHGPRPEDDHRGRRKLLQRLRRTNVKIYRRPLQERTSTFRGRYCDVILVRT